MNDEASPEHRELGPQHGPCRTRGYAELPDEVNFKDFNWAEWYRDEELVLDPQLRALGYSNIHFGMGEADSFGPLTRVIFTDQEVFIYG